MEQYELLDEIGSGSFGNVRKIRRKVDGKLLVWKELDYGKMGEKEKALLVSEVNILRELKHPHIVRYHDRIIDKERTKIYIIMEFCEGGDLSQIIRRHRRDRTFVDEDLIWKYLCQVLLALSECHTRSEGKILHRDIKPANVFLDKQQNVKLGDFGLARVLGKHSLFARTNVGTPFYMSPEQISEEAYNEKSDIWSVGCLVYELAALAPPFEATNQYALAVRIREGKFHRLPSRYSEELNRAISRMLQTEQALRPTVEELLALRPISYVIRERQLAKHYHALKQKEEELRRREVALEERERAVFGAVQTHTSTATTAATGEGLTTVASSNALTTGMTTVATAATAGGYLDKRRYSRDENLPPAAARYM